MVFVLSGPLVLMATLATLARAAVRRQDRGAWLAVGLGLVANTAGGIYFGHGGPAARHFPSPADACFLLFFPAVFIAGALFMRARLHRFSPAFLLDSAIAVLGSCAVVAQLLTHVVDRATGGGWPLAIALVYPAGDLLLIVAVLAVVALRGRRIGRGWGLLILGIVGRIAADVGHVWSGTASEAQGQWIAVVSVLSMGAIALAAWSPIQPPMRIASGGRRTLAVPSVLALVAASLLVLDHFHRTSDGPVWLAAATLVVVLVRMVLALHENQALHASRELALTDELTGLANRRMFGERLTAACASGDALAVAMADLDRFKELNDTLGHHAGDQLLAQLGPRLQAAVGDAALVARLGGDEFAILMPGAGLARAADLGRRLGVALQQPFMIEGLEVVMDASVGAALSPAHGTDSEALLQRADVAMYQAKQARTGFQVYDPARDRHSRERLSLIAELRRALERDELVLHYQPKVELATGRVAGVEALVRWQHPVHGLRGPGAFLPHAEHTALMRPLTLHVLETALAQLAEWRGAGLDLHVAVNLAVQNLLDLRTPAHVSELLAVHGLPPSSLVLEVTESLLLHDPARAGDVLRDLRDLGVGLALDDFGTGYSSLEHLKRLPVDELKIDRSFVMAMDHDPADRAIVASTAALGRSLGLRVVAEGVESAAADSVLTAIGCDLAQGFHYSPPVPAASVPALLRGTPGVGVTNLSSPEASIRAALGSAARR